MAIAAAGGSDPLGVHGAIVLLFGGVLAALVMGSHYEPELTQDHPSPYYDDPTKVGIAGYAAQLLTL